MSTYCGAGSRQCNGYQRNDVQQYEGILGLQASSELKGEADVENGNVERVPGPVT